MRAAKRWIGLCAVILLLGCARAPDGKVDARGAVSPAAADASRVPDDGGEQASLGGTPGGLRLRAGVLPGKCGEIEAAWTRHLATGGRCARAADCACYTASLLAPFGQTATDRATARAVRKLAAEFAARSCPTACMEGMPDRCQADCVDGRCVARYRPQH
jgi:hypothetical protein